MNHNFTILHFVEHRMKHFRNTILYTTCTACKVEKVYNKVGLVTPNKSL